MSADILRRAASLMRERAKVATPGPWLVDEDHPHIVMRPDKPGSSWDGSAVTAIQADDFGLTDLADAAHIASWHPLVSLAIASWLESTAAMWERLGSRPATEGQSNALAVARAYLGESA